MSSLIEDIAQKKLTNYNMTTKLVNIKQAVCRRNIWILVIKSYKKMVELYISSLFI